MIEVIKLRQQRIFFVFGAVITVKNKSPIGHQTVGSARVAAAAKLFFGGHALGVETQIEARTQALAVVETQDILSIAAQNQVHIGKRRFGVVKLYVFDWIGVGRIDIVAKLRPQLLNGLKKQRTNGRAEITQINQLILSALHIVIDVSVAEGSINIIQRFAVIEHVVFQKKAGRAGAINLLGAVVNLRPAATSTATRRKRTASAHARNLRPNRTAQRAAPKNKKYFFHSAKLVQKPQMLRF